MPKRFEGTQAEHKALGIAWHQEHGNMKGFEDTHGVYYDENGEPRRFRAFTSKGGTKQHYSHQRVSSVKSFQSERKAAENQYIEEITKAGQALGLPQSSIDAALKAIKLGNNRIKRFITNINRGLSPQEQQSTGHIRAVGAGGLNVPENQYQQNRSQNVAEGKKAEPDETAATMAGSPKDATQWWLRQMISKGVDPTRGLDAQTTQAIIDTGGDRDKIDDILTEYWSKRPGKRNAAGVVRGVAPVGTTKVGDMEPGSVFETPLQQSGLGWVQDQEFGGGGQKQTISGPGI